MIRLDSWSDKRILEIAHNEQGIYNDAAVAQARKISVSRGLVSKAGRLFILIASDGNQTKPLSIAEIKDGYLKKQFSPRDLVRSKKLEKWIALIEAFDIEKWQRPRPRRRDEQEAIAYTLPDKNTSKVKSGNEERRDTGGKSPGHSNVSQSELPSSGPRTQELVTPDLLYDEAYFRGWTRCLDFSGNSTRLEYWLFIITNALVFVGFELLFGSGSLPGLIWGFATLFPTITVSIRRLHDAGKTGHLAWLLAIPCVGFFMLSIFTLQASKQTNS